MINDSVALAQVLAGGRLPLSAALYVSGELARLVANEHDLGRTATGLDADHVRCTKGGGVVLSGARVQKPDARSDVHAVGTLMYRLLTGQTPAAKDIVAPSHFNPGVDSDLDALILAAVSHDPAYRPANVRVLETAIDAVFEELELEPAPQELAALVARAPRAAAPAAKPVKRAPPAGWYAAQTDEDEEGMESTATEVPSWQTQERERKWMVGITAALVAVALFWVNV